MIHTVSYFITLSIVTTIAQQPYERLKPALNETCQNRHDPGALAWLGGVSDDLIDDDIIYSEKRRCPVICIWNHQWV